MKPLPETPHEVMMRNQGHFDPIHVNPTSQTHTMNKPNTQVASCETPRSIDWIVKQPGEHGKKLRVVERVGLAVGGEEILAAVCEILTSRTSADNFSDATEQKRARLIAAAPDLLSACKVARDWMKAACFTNGEPFDTLNSAIEKAQGTPL